MTLPPRTTRTPRTADAPGPRGPRTTPAAGQGEQEGTQRRGLAARIHLGRAFHAESGSYFLLLGTTLFLVVFGLVMVLSSSSIDSFVAGGGFFGIFLKQGMFALIGIPLMLVVSLVPPMFWKRWAWILLIAACGVQLLVFGPLGVKVGENVGWIRVGGMTFQPAELIKVGLVLWLGFILARKRNALRTWREVLVPVLPIAGGAVGLVALGQDLGTVIIMASIVLGALFFAGVPVGKLGIMLAVGSVLAVIMTVVSDSRLRRVTEFLTGECDYAGGCWQATHGLYALAAGGVFGVGLGNSKAKWMWLPEADNDYIFAIIGEELGLIGAIVVILLFVVLAIGFIRVIRANTDTFARVATGAVMTWIIVQAFVNIGVVLNLLPVLGVPLPFVSSGGSSLVTTLVAMGIVLGFARKPTTEESPDVVPAVIGMRS
ncbi:putative lipid II flippase FtsW [Clavibacter michiganensis]|uniref:putative lipid II flippase FtsW n=1 Tax=Clavibacter michiganensis TaxID=28447 RepID=UPI000CE7ECD0|nr:putative lipid II flippase FtsW [Clavibacter michiganensis]PPF54913.1 putative lipid II flippase FtsW [Clavibacter michiganensis]